MKLFKVSILSGAGSGSSAGKPVMVRETRIGAFVRKMASEPGQVFQCEFVAEEEKSANPVKLGSAPVAAQVVVSGTN